MMSQANGSDADLYIGCAPEMGATQRLINKSPESLRIEAQVPPDATVLVVTHQRAYTDEIDQRVAATSAGISVSPSTKDHPAARQEINRATEADWTAASIEVNGEPHPANVFQLLSGTWVGYVQYEGAGIVLGSDKIDPREVRLATIRPSDLPNGGPEGE